MKLAWIGCLEMRMMMKMFLVIVDDESMMMLLLLIVMMMSRMKINLNGHESDIYTPSHRHENKIQGSPNEIRRDIS